jgi:hypothetical protein
MGQSLYETESSQPFRTNQFRHYILKSKQEAHRRVSDQRCIDLQNLVNALPPHRPEKRPEKI